MPHALDLDNFGVAEQLIHHAIITNADSVCALGTSQFLGAMRQWLVSELLYSRDDPQDGFARNTAQVLPRGLPPLQTKGGHHA